MKYLAKNANVGFFGAFITHLGYGFNSLEFWIGIVAFCAFQTARDWAIEKECKAEIADLIEAAKSAEKTIDILWASHHANRADDALDKLRSALAKSGAA